MAIVFRFAFEMGYHRDPDQFSHLSVFEGEMRRRVWYGQPLKLIETLLT